jgi:RNA polymerase sigma-70 factor (ECF subfamily)
MMPGETIVLNEQTLAGDVETQAQVDTEFLEKLKLGDAEAFDNLIVLYINDVYKLLFRLTADEEEARDLTQETFLRALKAVKRFRGESNLKTWLFSHCNKHIAQSVSMVAKERFSSYAFARFIRFTR